MGGCGCCVDVQQKGPSAGGQCSKLITELTAQPSCKTPAGLWDVPPGHLGGTHVMFSLSLFSRCTIRINTSSGGKEIKSY